MTKFPSINLLFEKVENGLYSGKSKTFHAYLEYANSHNQFKYWDLGKYLCSHTDPDVKITGTSQYDTTNTIIECKREGILGNLKKLVQLGLLTKSPARSKKTDARTSLYEITASGRIVLTLIEFLWPRKNSQTRNFESLFTSLTDYLELQNSVETDLTARFYLKCKENGLFPFLIELLEKMLESKDPEFQFDNALDLFTIIRSPFAFTIAAYGNDKEYLEQKAKTNELFLEAIDELDPRSKDIFLFLLKHDLESRAIETLPPREWEEAWMDQLGNSSKFVGYGYCKECREKYPVVADVLEYFGAISINGEFPVSDCEKCGKEGSLHIAYFYAPSIFFQADEEMQKEEQQ